MKMPEHMKFPFYCSALFLCVATAISLLVFGGIPHVQDSIAQFVHAKALLNGSTTLQSHKYPEFFNILLMINDKDGQWYSQYPLGHISLLAVGHLFHAPWLINPIVGSATVFTTYYLAKETHGRTTARLATVLMLLSPFVLFMSAEFMNHSTTLLFCTVFILFFIKSLKTTSLKYPLYAGAALGAMFITRPYSSFGIVIPFIIWGIYLLIKNQKYIKQFTMMTAAFSVFGALQLWFNYTTTGDPFVFGYSVMFGDKVKLGFGAVPWGEPHTFPRGISNLSSNLFALNDYLFSWPIPSLLFAIIALFIGRDIRYNYLFLSIFISLAMVYVLYFFQDLCFGPRYLYEAATVLIILSAHGIICVYNFATKLHHKAGLGFASIMCAICLYTVAFNYPPLIEKYADRYWKVESFFLADIEELELQNALVFISSKYRHVASTNPPQNDSNIIYAINRDFYSNTNENQKLKDYYPTRNVYVEQHGKLTKIR